MDEVKLVDSWIKVIKKAMEIYEDTPSNGAIFMQCGLAVGYYSDKIHFITTENDFSIEVFNILEAVRYTIINAYGKLLMKTLRKEYCLDHTNINEYYWLLNMLDLLKVIVTKGEHMHWYDRSFDSEDVTMAKAIHDMDEWVKLMNEKLTEALDTAEKIIMLDGVFKKL